jgi:hypothetical protein
MIDHAMPRGWLSTGNIAAIGNVLNHSGLQHTAIHARLKIFACDVPPLPSQAISTQSVRK